MKADTGPWTVDTWSNTGKPEIVLVSDDFTHDVALKISGDFVDNNQKLEYAEALAAHMNGLPPSVEPEKDNQIFNVGDTVQLKSGGPLMTVFNADDGSPICSCLYYNARAGEFVRTFFDVALLKHSSLLKIRAGR